MKEIPGMVIIIVIIVHPAFADATSISTSVEGILIFGLSLSWFASLLYAGRGVSPTCSILSVATRAGACATVVLRREGNVWDFANDVGEEVELVFVEDGFFEMASGNALTIAHARSEGGFVAEGYHEELQSFRDDYRSDLVRAELVQLSKGVEETYLCDFTNILIRLHNTLNSRNGELGLDDHTSSTGRR